MAWKPISWHDGVPNAPFSETFLAEETGIALAARPTLPIRIITAMSKSKVQAQLGGDTHDIRFTERDQRRVNVDGRAAFDARFGRQVGHIFESVDELGAAVRVAGVVERIHADENVGGLENLRPRQRIRKKNGVARGN